MTRHYDRFIRLITVIIHHHSASQIKAYICMLHTPAMTRIWSFTYFDFGNTNRAWLHLLLALPGSAMKVPPFWLNRLRCAAASASASLWGNPEGMSPCSTHAWNTVFRLPLFRRQHWQGLHLILASSMPRPVNSWRSGVGVLGWTSNRNVLRVSGCRTIAAPRLQYLITH